MTSPAVHPSHMQGVFLRAVILPKVLQTERIKTQNLALLGSLGVLVCHLEYYLLFIVITGVQISNLIIQYMKQISSTEKYVCSGVLKFRVFGMLTVVSPEVLEGLHLLPTDHPPPCFNVLSSSVLVFQVVGMLPHI